MVNYCTLIVKSYCFLGLWLLSQDDLWWLQASDLPLNKKSLISPTTSSPKLSHMSGTVLIWEQQTYEPFNGTHPVIITRFPLPSNSRTRLMCRQSWCLASNSSAQRVDSLDSNVCLPPRTFELTRMWPPTERQRVSTKHSTAAFYPGARATQRVTQTPRLPHCFSGGADSCFCF